MNYTFWLFRAERYRFLLICVIFLAGCAGPVSLYKAQPSVSLEWPPQNAGPKIVWIKSIAGPDNAGITKSFWKRALDLLIGEDDNRIVRPYGVLFDDKERLVIADPGGGVVHVMNIKENSYAVIGGNDSSLRNPIGLAEDEHDLLYITDSAKGVVYKYDFNKGLLLPFFKGTLQRPTGIAYNRINKLLYVVDTTARQVIAVNEAGMEELRFGLQGPVQFNRPTDIGVDRKGAVYVTDPLNYKIKIFSPDGTMLNQIGMAGDTPGSLNKPKGVAVDSEGHIYVNDALQDGVQVFDDSGQLLLFFGRSGSGDGEFWMPSGIFIDGHDYIFVADTYNQRIQVFRYVPREEPPVVPVSGDQASRPQMKP
jgi:DNA-binding beta-propeller fold protein YncE